MTLRERLIALADANDDAMSGTDWAEHKMRYIVLAAAKLALDDAAKACDSSKYIADSSHTAIAEGVRGGMRQCAANIRALRDGL